MCGQWSEVDGVMSWTVKCRRQCNGVGSGLLREMELCGH